MELLDVITPAYSWAVGLAAVIILFYLYMKKVYSYWDEYGIPCVKHYPIIGSFGSFFTKKFHEVELGRYKKYGRLYGAYEFTRPVLSIAEMDLLKDIFVKDFISFPNRRTFKIGDPTLDSMVSIVTGDEWKRIRTVITPAFTSGKLRKIVSIVNESAKTVAENFSTAAHNGRPVDCKRLFGAFTMDVICSSAFGMKLDSHNNPDNPMVANARKVFARDISWRFIAFMIWPSLAMKLHVSIFPPTVIGFFKDVTQILVKERRERGETRDDFLQLMMDAAENEGTSEDLDESMVSVGHEEENSKIFNQNIKNKSLSQDELVAQSILFFLAGYETTASTLSYVAYNLAQNPECQERLIQEVDTTFAKHKEIDYDVVKSMQYLDCVCAETLRMFPPAIRAERRAEEDYTLGDTGILIRKDMIVSVPIYAIHYDEEYYPNPEKFDPDRFLPENKATRNSYSYLPFGAGPRNCIGMRFAQMEMKLCLVHIYRHFRFRVCPETKIPLDFYVGNGLLVAKDVTLAVEPRTDIPAA